MRLHILHHFMDIPESLKSVLIMLVSEHDIYETIDYFNSVGNYELAEFLTEHYEL